MTDYIGEWAARHQPVPRGDDGGKKRRCRTRFTFPWVWLVTPSNGGFYGMHTAVAFDVFRYLAETAVEHVSADASGWGQSGPAEVLSLSSALTSGYVSGFTGPEFMDSLRKRFLNALFETPRAEATVQWRQALNLYVGETADAPVRYYNPQFEAHPICSAVFEQCVRRLLAVVDCQLRDSWNPCHRQALWVCCNSLTPRARTGGGRQTGWNYSLNYAYRHDDSTWGISVANQGPRETFHDFVVRCNLILDRLVYDPPAMPKQWNREVDFAALYAGGDDDGPLEPVQLTHEQEIWNGRRKVPLPVKQQKRTYTFRGELHRRDSQSGHATVTVTATSEAAAREVVEARRYDSVQYEGRPHLDLTSLKRITNRKPQEASQ